MRTWAVEGMWVVKTPLGGPWQYHTELQTYGFTSGPCHGDHTEGQLERATVAEFEVSKLEKN